jgi:hypothetical protein
MTTRPNASGNADVRGRFGSVRRRGGGAPATRKVGVIAVALAMLGCLSTIAYAEEPWDFIWVGATKDTWIVVQGQGMDTREKSDLHFALRANTGDQYVADIKVLQGDNVEAGFAGIGSAYRGITAMQGTYTAERDPDKGKCGLEIIQLHNEFNSLALKRRICQK